MSSGGGLAANDKFLQLYRYTSALNLLLNKRTQKRSCEKI